MLRRGVDMDGKEIRGGKNNQKMYMYEMPENKINFKKKKKK